MDEFQDITPLPIEDASVSICQIMYTEEYKQLLGIARALMVSKEYSQRALDLTTKVMEMVPAYYTIYNYRYNIVKALYEQKEYTLDQELSWLDEFTLNNPKNYQIWSYRQSLLELHESPDLHKELPVMDIMIADDTKNYHVWSYRKWCVLFFNDFSKELEFVEKYIENDVYNNSAWCHRMFALKHVEYDFDVEEEYVRHKIVLAPQNVSSWNYLLGLYELAGKDLSLLEDFCLQFVNGFFEEEDAEPLVESTRALELLAQIYKGSRATKCYDALIEKYDTIRSNYWNQLKAKV